MIRFSDLLKKRKAIEVNANINPETSEIFCPTCKMSNFEILEEEKISEEIYHNHCKCENCGQAFVYKVDKKNNIILKKDIKSDSVTKKAKATDEIKRE